MIQFRVTRLFGLSIQLDGYAMVDEQGIQLAFNKAVDEEQHLLDAKVETIRITWKNLAAWEIDYGFLGDELKLTVHSTAELGSFPSDGRNQLSLDVRKSERDVLKEFEQRIKDYQSGQRSDNVEDLLDDVRDFLTDL